MEWLAALPILALAVNGMVETARHGEPFAGRRALAEARRAWRDRLFLCGFCLSVWVGPATGLAWAACGPWTWGRAGMGLLAGLAAARLANL